MIFLLCFPENLVLFLCGRYMTEIGGAGLPREEGENTSLPLMPEADMMGIPLVIAPLRFL